MENKIKSIKQKYVERYALTEMQAKNDIVFYEFGNKILVGMAFCDHSMQDQNYYLFDSATIDDLYNKPIAQIKFMQDNQPTMFIRRLEFVDNNYKGKGYASALIKCFEHYCAKNGFLAITGEFIPLHDEPEQKVEAYYRKNGYDIVKDENEQEHIYKKLKKFKLNTVCGCGFVADTKKEEEQTM